MYLSLVTILSFDATRRVGVIRYDNATYIRSIEIIKTKDELPPTYNIPETNIIMLIMQAMALNKGVSISLSNASRLDNKSEARDEILPER